ncbi:MAG TPA: sigma-54-dependent Fis family transcriptional regulator [Vicinamibacteria bacterium]|nr:sigma-54-dependent Fis family transcriptional regulator [Vicinamibacteria bacterium]
MTKLETRRGMVDELSDETILDPTAPLSADVARSSAERMVALYGIGKLLLEQRDAIRVIHTIHRALVAQLAPDHACVLTVDSNGAHRPVAAHQVSLDGPERLWPISRTALRRARETGMALLATDVLQDPQFDGSGSVQRFNIRSVLCVPLGREPVRGLIYLDRRREMPPFDRADLQFLTAAAGYASTLLDRIEDHERESASLKNQAEALALLQEELLRHRLVGKAPTLLKAYDEVRRLASAGARVLLRGETGTGKELFARAYAANTGRQSKPYIPVPIPALAPNLIESELFGHLKGAFTEASRDKKGYFEVANGGVLFLDEIGDIDPALQVKLLRFLDSGEIYPVGDTRPKFLDVLVVSATNRPLERLVEQGRFRSDLLARLGHTITIPPLRERPEDIPLLVEHFARKFGRGSNRRHFAPETMELFGRYPWEFNVRQLQQVVERSTCLVDHDVIVPADLPDFLRTRGTLSSPRGSGTPASLKRVVEDAERRHILETLEFAKGNRRKAIELLGVSPETFYKRLQDMGLHKKSER